MVLGNKTGEIEFKQICGVRVCRGAHNMWKSVGHPGAVGIRVLGVIREIVWRTSLGEQPSEVISTSHEGMLNWPTVWFDLQTGTLVLVTCMLNDRRWGNRDPYMVIWCCKWCRIVVRCGGVMVLDSSVVIESKTGRGVTEIGMLLWLHNQWHHLQHHGPKLRSRSE
jgi:hypothetical protein